MVSAATRSATPVSSRWRALAGASPLVLLLDLDGTVIDFAPTPAQAVLDSAAVDLLNELIAVGVHVVVVSGRTRESIDALRALVPGAWWAAEHGSWRWAPALEVKPALSASALSTLANKLGSLLATPGVLVERKSLSLCIHWRLVDETAREVLARELESACDEWLEEHPGFERLAGVELLEVRQRGANKGNVVSWVRDRIRGARLIAIGDDFTDEDMFAELDDADVSIAVGSRISDADARAKGTAEVRAFLRWLIATRTGGDAPFSLIPATRAAPRKRHRLVVMSNRTPNISQGRTREVGGLVSALAPALRDERGIWLGWTGLDREHPPRLSIDADEQPARAKFDLPTQLRRAFYAGFCNSVLWPLLHGFPSRVHYNERDFEAYVQANDVYARYAIDVAQRDATIWVHDYHLLFAARALRALGHEGRIGLFLHVPFPAREVLETIPWARDLVEAMLDFDLLGFQTQQAAANFLACAHGRNNARGRVVEVGVFPATIDPRPFRAVQEVTPEIARLRADLGSRRLILGVDRLDYTKGIPERLVAYERMLERSPQWHRQVSFLQISVPTRTDLPEYAELRERVERLVGRINGQFGDTDWVPVRYLYRSYDHGVLAQLYRLADVALVTPLRDGMNLVAKEFIAAQEAERPGVLVLSQQAGAADTLGGAVITNPFHPEGLASDLECALAMPVAERVRRHQMLLVALEQEGDAKAWARRFLDRLAPRRLHTVD